MTVMGDACIAMHSERTVHLLPIQDHLLPVLCLPDLCGATAGDTYVGKEQSHDVWSSMF